MKITEITCSNFLGARAVDLRLRKPVAMFAGKNGSGKSSIQEAFRMALTGETVRVALQKQYGELITEGCESGFVAVATETAGYEAVLPSGKGNHCDIAALPYVLDAQRFASLNANDRRQFLFGLMGVKLDGAAVKTRLLQKDAPEGANWKPRGCCPEKVERIMPIMRAGFDAATKEAASKARDAKASWKTAMGGEAWGKEKAPKWQPADLPEGAEQVATNLLLINKQLAAIEADLAVAQQAFGAKKASEQQRKEAEGRRAGLEAIAGTHKRYTEKLARDTAELANWEKKVADCRARAGQGSPDPRSPGEYLLRGLASVTNDFLTLSCDFPGVEWPSSLINRASVQLAEYRKLHGDPSEVKGVPDPEAILKLPEYENALALMKSAVANSTRDLEAAKTAATQLLALDVINTGAADSGEVEARVAELSEQRKRAQAEAEKLRDLAGKVERRGLVIAQVAKLHSDVMEWTAIADALAPDGIPAELLTEALDPINEHLRLSAADAEWEPAQINPDMTITYGTRDYALISESEKWRADAMIAEAVAHLSGIKLLVLDRFDVLDMKGREDLLYWLDGLATDGMIDTALIFGTLKALPALNFDTIDAFWIENGATGQLKEAA